MCTPTPDGVADRLGSFGADRRKEAHEKVAPLGFGLPRLETVAEKVELHLWIASLSSLIPAIDDFRLVRMHRQTTLGKTPLDLSSA